MAGTASEWDALVHASAQKAWGLKEEGAKYTTQTARVLGAVVAPGLYDEVHTPLHYNQGLIECIDAIKASMTPLEFKGYLKGNALKYLWRYAYKDKPVQDLAKAEWYLDRLRRELD